MSGVTWPTELVAKAMFEQQIFERVSSETSAELIAEVIRLRELAKNMANAIYNLESSAGITGYAHAVSLADQVET